MARLLAGLKNHPLIAIGHWIAAFGVLWTAVDALTYFVPTVILQGLPGLLTMAVLGLGYALARSVPPSKVEIPIHNTGSKIEVKFGDLFTEPGLRAISVSEYFESAIGTPVSEKSIHGIFLQKCFGGHPEAFDSIVAKELKGKKSTMVKKTIGKTRKYDIGTTALVRVNDDKYLCFALTMADPKTCKVSADVETLWHALTGLWQKARETSGGNPVNLPLVGSGLAGVGLPPKELLNLLILSIIDETKRKAIAETIRLIIGEDRRAQIDLSEVRRYWR